jgi:SAM-dependent methyltransferase
MSSEQALPLDQGTVDLFALKGTHVGCTVPQTNNINGLKVRRVMQLIRDFSKKPLDQIRVLDLACGEGVYAIEAALRGAQVMGVDARTERMNEGAKVAERLGLKNLKFEQCDVRKVAIGSHGSVDVVLFLGILYHLDQRDVFPVLKNIFEMCEQFLIIDTHIALQNRVQIEHEGRIYEGEHYREHDRSDSEAVRKSRLMASVDNPTSFWFTRESLYRLLHDVGFTSVCECSVPLEPFKPDNRVTLIAAKGEPVRVSSYPWMNGKTEAEIESSIADQVQASGRKAGAARAGVISRTLGALGLERRRR